jgi:hypothetical protein
MRIIRGRRVVYETRDLEQQSRENGGQNTSDSEQNPRNIAKFCFDGAELLVSHCDPSFLLRISAADPCPVRPKIPGPAFQLGLARNSRTTFAQNLSVPISIGRPIIVTRRSVAHPGPHAYVVARERFAPNEPIPARVRTVLSRGRGCGERCNPERTDGGERHKALSQHVTSPESEMVQGIGRSFTYRMVAPRAEKVQRSSR